jgi:hypothetical protein
MWALYKLKYVGCDAGIPLMVDFCAEGVADDPKGEMVLDDNARQFARSAVWAGKFKNYLFSIKVSGLVDMHLLKKYNQAAMLRERVWRKGSEAGVVKPDRLFEAFQKIYGGVT